MDYIYKLQDLHAHYLTRFGKEVHAVNGVDLELKEGEIFGIAGESGCGKSTLVQAGMGLYLPPLFRSKGQVLLEGQDICGLSQEELRKNILGLKISIIPQGAMNSLNPTMKVWKLGFNIFKSHQIEVDKKECIKRMEERFSKIGLPAHVLQRYPFELSGGMKQRVVIALSTLLNPKVVIADEPTSALDVSTQKAVIELLIELMKQKIISSMIFITHELPLLKHVSHNIAVMYGGQFVEVSSSENIINRPQHPYTKALMSSMLLAESGSKKGSHSHLEGFPPSLSQEPSFCTFHTRCPEARESCSKNKQSLVGNTYGEVRCEYA